MHKGMGLGVLLLALALGRPAAAQEASSILTGVRPDQITYDKNYYKQMSRAFDRSQIITTPTIQKSFNPSSYFLPHLPSVSLPSWVPLIGSKPQPRRRAVPLAQQPQRRTRPNDGSQ
jgi:hypothetical protein